MELETGILDPNDKLQNTESSEGNEYTPTPEEERTIKLGEKVFKKSKKWRSKYDKDWLGNYKFVRGQQWNEQRPSYRHSEVINMVFQAIQSSVPMITDSRPKFEFLPQDPSDIQFAEIMNQVAQNDWQRNNWLYKLTEAVYDAHFYGQGYGYIGYDPKAKKGQGDIVFCSKDPFYQFPDPNAKDCNESCKFWVDAEPVDIEVIKSEYPELGKFVKADLEDLSGGDKTDIEEYYKFRLPIDQTKSLRESAGNTDGFLEKKCLKKTVYMLSDEIFEKEVLNDEGIPEYEQRLKYPQGRKFVIAGGVLLEDGPIPYEDKKFPYARLTNYILPREFFGISEVEQLKGPQKIYNKIISFALDVLTLMGNPVWVVDTEADVDTDNLMNKPGLIIEKNKNGNVQRQEGVQLQPYVLQLLNTIKVEFEGISGRSDVSQGLTPSGVTAASAIAALQEAAQTRIRLKARNLDAFLQDLGQMWLSRTLQYRNAPEIIRITGNDEAAKYFQFHVETQMDEMGQPLLDEKGNPRRQAVVRPSIVDPETGQAGFGEAQTMEIKGDLDVQVSTGSSLPFMKAQKAQDAKDLFNMGIIDQEEVLSTLDWPNWQAVKARMDQKAQEMAMQQAQQAAPPPPEGAPPPPPQDPGVAA